MFLYLNNKLVKNTLVERSFTITNFGFITAIKIHFCHTETKKFENMTIEQDHPHWEFFRIVDLTSPFPSKLDHCKHNFLYLETTFIMENIFTSFQTPQIDPSPKVECPICYPTLQNFKKAPSKP